MNSSISSAQPTTAAETNRSPRKKPRRARPKAASSTSMAIATAAPAPMPNWLTGSSPNAACSAAMLQPRAPMAKPASSSASAPRPPPASHQAPCARDGGRQAPTAATARPSGAASSHQRPSRSACIRPLAASPASQVWARPCHQAVSCWAYQGSSRKAARAMIRHHQAGALGRVRIARVYRGSEPTSFSQRAIRRRRSALEPYFL